jgi:uncharacterized membrane protein
MIEFVYQTLAKIGYTHPIHPPLTHVTVGMVIGAFVFGIVAWKFRHQGLSRTAHHCIILALIAFLPTVLLGFMDWQYYFAGGWLLPIKAKFALAGFLLVLLVFAISVGPKGETVSKSALIIYGACLINVTALGYFGGELLFGGSSPGKAAGVKGIEISSEQFTRSCSSCHPGGGNSIKQDLPLKSAPQLVNFETFLAYIRDPKARDGSRTVMPQFSPDKLSEQQAREIYQYVTQVLRKN